MCFPAFEGGRMSDHSIFALRTKIAEALEREDLLKCDTGEWYEKVGINESHVHLMHRSIAKHPRFYPQRKPIDAWTNAFEPTIHGEFVDANMDIQAVGSWEATLKYILKYQFKNEPTREAEANLQGRNAYEDRNKNKELTFKVSNIIIFV